MSVRGRTQIRDGIIIQQSDHLPEDLLPDAQNPKVMTFKKPSQFMFSCMPPKSMPSSRVSRSLSTASLKKTGDWLAHKPYIQLSVDAESGNISTITQSVLDKENHYSQSVDEYLRQADTVELRRKEMQHKRWTDRVSEPLQKTIERYIDSQSSEDIERRRRFLLEQYLKYCNVKGSAFMRDYDSSEYNPFIYQRNKKCLRESTPPFGDPLLYQIEKRLEEDRIALHCETGRLYSAKEKSAITLPPVPLSRQSINSVDWVKTPFRFIDSEMRQKSRHKIKGTMNKGTINLKAWNQTSYPPAQIDIEMKICHKRKFTKSPSQTSVF
ncbi:protein FAM228B [Pelodytes ibericus]